MENEWTAIRIKKSDKELLDRLARKNRRSVSDQIMVWADQELAAEYDLVSLPAPTAPAQEQEQK